MVFLGRLHPVFVHFPVVLLLLAGGLELYMIYRPGVSWKSIIPLIFLLGIGSGIIAVFTGLQLKNEGGYQESLLLWHRNGGYITLIIASIIYLLKYQFKLFKNDHFKHKSHLILFIGLNLSMMVGVTITGHKGASMTHGEDYLSIELLFQKEQELKVRINPIENIDSAYVYSNMVKQVLDAKCVACHGKSKQKGKLRLDTEVNIRAGGKQGEVLMLADSNGLLTRIKLPLNHENHMPPNERPQLTQAEVKLFELWIGEGGNFKERVTEFKYAEQLLENWKLIIASYTPKWVAPEDGLPEMEVGLKELFNSKGVITEDISTDYHFINLIFRENNKMDEINEADLENIAPYVVGLQLKKVEISAKTIQFISKCRNLRTINLSQSLFQEQLFDQLTQLHQLERINLNHCDVSQSILDVLESNPKLQIVYLNGSKVENDLVARIKTSYPNITLELGGYQLPVLASDTIQYLK